MDLETQKQFYLENALEQELLAQKKIKKIIEELLEEKEG